MLRQENFRYVVVIHEGIAHFPGLNSRGRKTFGLMEYLNRLCGFGGISRADCCKTRFKLISHTFRSQKANAIFFTAGCTGHPSSDKLTG